MTLRRILSCLLLLLPWLAQAGDGADFAAASRTQQATLLQQWAAAPQASRLPLLQRAMKAWLSTRTNSRSANRLTSFCRSTAPGSRTAKPKTLHEQPAARADCQRPRRPPAGE